MVLLLFGTNIEQTNTIETPHNRGLTRVNILFKSKLICLLLMYSQLQLPIVYQKGR